MTQTGLKQLLAQGNEGYFVSQPAHVTFSTLSDSN